MVRKFALHKLLGILILLTSFSSGWLIMDIQSFMQSPLTLPYSMAGHLPMDTSLADKKYWYYTVEPGSSLTAVAYALQRNNVLAHPRYLIWSARWQGKADQIKAGEYAFEPGTTVAQLLEKITRGDVIQYPVTIIEGWSFRQLLQYLAGLKGLEHTLAGLEPSAVMSRLDKPGEHPEGRFFPDTYYYTRGMTDAQILKRAYNDMEQFLQRAWQTRDGGLPYQDAYEALIMASIIEKETAVADERGQIAGVFVRRLQQNMRLQTDPTVIYGIGEHFDGNLRRRDLKADTPYNTYKHHGLPPSPIAMPGGESIEAALHPSDGDTLYFVARGDGTHHFSATIAEHNRAVRKYQLKRR
jgi:UPF0755 protein